jgi:GNAT superfamily N-acetyltransferase
LHFREATVADIDAYMVVRLSVKENVLSDPTRVTKADNVDHLTHFGKGWVCERNDTIVGFSIVDLQRANVWALFVHPDHEGLGIGNELHRLMLDWYFSQTAKTLGLGTGIGTRAADFYRRRGWREIGFKSDEILFEMTSDDWKRTQTGNNV